MRKIRVGKNKISIENRIKELTNQERKGLSLRYGLVKKDGKIEL